MEKENANLCDICNNEENDESHKKSATHRLNYMLANYQQNKKSLRNSRYGVELTIDVEPVNGFRYDFAREPSKSGCHLLNMSPADFKSHGNQVEFTCKLKNSRTKKEDPIVITYAGVLHSFKPYSMIDPLNNTDQWKFVTLRAGAIHALKVRLKLDASHVSKYKIPIYFSIQTLNQANEEMETFSIARSIDVAIHDIEEVPRDDDEKNPFTNKRWEKVDEIVPPNITKRRWLTADKYRIPQNYWRTMIHALTKDFGDGVLQDILQKLHPRHVTLENYNDFFHILLWMEEVCATIGLSSYNMENVNLAYIGGNMLRLKVPGLAEKRPSVIRGDLIEIKVHGDHTTYQGIVQSVGDKTVNIEGLDEIILDTVKHDPDMQIDVRFVLGRIHFERMHQGVDQVVQNGFVSQLFPSERLLSSNVSDTILLAENDMFNQLIFNNREQMIAVQKIINNASKGAPYIVNGPPGTGKTVTIVEAIYHLKRLTKSTILVCAPANAACNMLTEKLSAFCSKSELTRIMSETCDVSSVHPNIVPYCNVMVEDDGEKVVVPFLKENLKKYRIVVTTLVFAGRYGSEFQPDIVFLDEAAQAREPEACCAIGLLMKNKRLVLAGDPQQLGPVVHSNICKEYEYHKSLLERLINLPLYKNDSRNNFTTMLKLNFRSHAEILKLPNEEFYEGKLQAVSASANNDLLAKTYIYKLIVNGGNHNQTGAPIEFCSLLFKEKREGRSPSYYNPMEVLMVKKYVEKLISLRFPHNPEMHVTAGQIGVVTPYIRQVYKIREALHPQFADVEIGTTEAFQGREKRVMIISTVRAQEDLLLQDKKYQLGFVKEKKRFNVAITRAISKLIVVGNPLVLKTDDKWKRLIEQATILGTNCGAPCPQSEHPETRLQKLNDRFNQFHFKDIRPNNGR